MCQQWIPFNLNCSQYDCQFTWAHSKCAHDDKCTYTIMIIQLILLPRIAAATKCLQEKTNKTISANTQNRTKHIAIMADNVACTCSAPATLEWFELRLVYHAFTCLLFEGLRFFAELLRFIPRFLRIYFGLPKKMTAFTKKEVNHWSISIKCCVYTKNHNKLNQEIPGTTLTISLSKLFHIFHHSGDDLQQWLSSLPMLFPTLLWL